MDTNELVRQVKNGDTEAFGQIYDAFAQRIFRYIRLKVQNKNEAEDILQEVFVKAYRGLDKLELKDLNFTAWLYRIASNTINDFFRKKYRTPEILSLDESFDVSDGRSLQNELANKSDVETVRAAFEYLPSLYKQVLELRFLQELSLDEIAEILNKTNLSVRLIQFRALKKVQVILKKTSSHVDKQ